MFESFGVTDMPAVLLMGAIIFIIVLVDARSRRA